MYIDKSFRCSTSQSYIKKAFCYPLSQRDIKAKAMRSRRETPAPSLEPWRVKALERALEITKKMRLESMERSRREITDKIAADIPQYIPRGVLAGPRNM